MKQENAIFQEKYQVRLVVASLIFTFKEWKRSHKIIKTIVKNFVKHTKSSNFQILVLGYTRLCAYSLYTTCEI